MNEKREIWKCPYCGYQLLDILLRLAKFDYGCPRCKAPLGDFCLLSDDENEGETELAEKDEP